MNERPNFKPSKNNKYSCCPKKLEFMNEAEMRFHIMNHTYWGQQILPLLDAGKTNTEILKILDCYPSCISQIRQQIKMSREPLELMEWIAAH